MPISLRKSMAAGRKTVLADQLAPEFFTPNKLKASTLSDSKMVK